MKKYIQLTELYDNIKNLTGYDVSWDSSDKIYLGVGYKDNKLYYENWYVIATILELSSNYNKTCLGFDNNDFNDFFCYDYKQSLNKKIIYRVFLKYNGTKKNNLRKMPKLQE